MDGRSDSVFIVQMKPFDLMTKTENICRNFERLMALCQRFCSNIYRESRCVQSIFHQSDKLFESLFERKCAPASINLS